MPAEPRNPIDLVSALVGVFLNVAGYAVLTVASLVYVFQGYCEDDCVRSPRSTGAALAAAAPWAIGAVVLFAAAAYVLVLSARTVRSPAARALLLGLATAVVFEVGLYFVVVTVSAISDSTLALVAGLAVVVAAWLPLEVFAARR